MSRCENCPASWEDRSYEGECNSWGCLIMGAEIESECGMSNADIKKRLQQLKDYEAGKIERPQWVANRFMRELDSNWYPFHSLGIFLPGYPPPKMYDGCYCSIHSSMGLNDTYWMAYREGYRDGAEGREMKQDRYERKAKEPEDPFEVAD